MGRQAKRVALFYILFIGLWLSCGLVAADQIEVIDLQHRTASEMIPLVEPLVGTRGVVTGNGFRLIVRAPDDIRAQVHELVARLDRAPQKLRISLKRGHQKTHRSTDVGASGTVRVGDAKVRINEGGPATIEGQAARRHADTQGIQTIYTLDGQQAFIQTGQVVPIGDRYVDGYGHIHEGVRYQDVTTGFYVLPRLAGEQVTLEIRAHDTAVNRHGRLSFQTQKADTVLRGQIGEWLPLAGVSQTWQQSRQGVLAYGKRETTRDDQLYIKVDVVADQ